MVDPQLQTWHSDELGRSLPSGWRSQPPSFAYTSSERRYIWSAELGLRTTERQIVGISGCIEQLPLSSEREREISKCEWEGNFLRLACGLNYSWTNKYSGCRPGPTYFWAGKPDKCYNKVGLAPTRCLGFMSAPPRICTYLYLYIPYIILKCTIILNDFRYCFLLF